MNYYEKMWKNGISSVDKKTIRKTLDNIKLPWLHCGCKLLG
jgi:hypothetical protein